MIINLKVLSIKRRILHFIGSPISDYCDFIINEDKESILDDIYSYLISHQNLCDNIKLDEIPEKSTTLSLSKKLFVI